MALHIENISVDESYEICIANFEYVVPCLVVLMDVDTACSHDGWDIVLTNEGVPSLEAPASAECVHYVIHTQDDVSKNAIFRANVHVRQFVDVDWLLRAQDRVVHVHALTQEQFVQLLNVVACSEHALVVPEVIQVVPAHPVHHVLVLIVEVNFEAVSRGKPNFKLLPGDECVREDLDLVFFFLKQVLQDHGSVGLVLGHQVEAHLVGVFGRVLVSEAFLLTQRVDVAQSLAARRIFVPH